MDVTLPDEYLDEIKTMVRQFLEKPLAQDIRYAEQVLTELPVYHKGKYHGNIDLLMVSGGKIRILDFKSDLLNEKAEEIKAHYAKQLGLYVDGVRELTGRDVEGECVYLFEKQIRNYS